MKRKIYTLITNPKGVLVKYIRWNRLLARLRGLLPPYYNESYDKHWNHVSFKDKIVLDLGADYGSTASYFLWRGAKHVIAVEADKELAKQLRKNFKNNSKVTPIELFIEFPKDIDNLINKYNPDIVKVDIEGYEMALLGCQNLQKVKEWLIECHSQEIYKKIKSLFLQKDFKVTTIKKIFPNNSNKTVLVASKL